LAALGDSDGLVRDDSGELAVFAPDPIIDVVFDVGASRRR